ncbi:MAG: hypothetical protein ACRERU_06325 [Methylococcales bacterium]
MKIFNRFLRHLSYLPFIFMVPQAFGNEVEAYEYLNAVMDQFQSTVDVYNDLGAAGNHFAARCAMVPNPNNPSEIAAVGFDETWSTRCHGGSTCIRNTFHPVDSAFSGGWYFQNGVLNGSATAPACNWEDQRNAGLDLRGATELRFWARGEQGGERVEFFVGGVGRFPFSEYASAPYPDSLPRVPEQGQPLTLTRDCKQYTISLKGFDLSSVIGGFGWMANAPNNPQGATFYVDDIRYRQERPNELRFLQSYQTLPTPPANDFDTVLKNAAYVYDNTVALHTYLARGASDDLRRAKILADTLIYAQAHDRYFNDGRLRNAYQAGDIASPPGWMPNGRAATARLPSFWNTRTKQWLEDIHQASTDTGNMAWVMLAWMRAYEVLGDQKYLDATRRLGEWVVAHTHDPLGAGGFTGGYEGWEPNPTARTWKSTEHNLDLYATFMRLSDQTDGPEKAKWRDHALHAKRFATSMWGACEADRFATSTTNDGITPNCTFSPTDVNTWGLMVLGNAGSYGRGVDWVLKNGKVAEPCLGESTAAGIDFNTDRDGIWWEGTAHTVVAARIKGDMATADDLLSNLRLAQLSATRTNGKAL